MLIQATVKCDWPACNKTLAVKPSPGAFRARGWAQQIWLEGCHLCDKHRHKTWKQLADVMQAANEEKELKPIELPKRSHPGKAASIAVE